MNRLKLLGQKLMSRDFDRQTAELQVRIAIPDRFTAPGIPITQPIGGRHAGLGEIRPSGASSNSALDLDPCSIA